MRLIDGDVASHILNVIGAREMHMGEKTAFLCRAYDPSSVMVGYSQGLKDAASAIQDSPTIEAEPVRHGRWIDKENPQWRAYEIRYCSECGWSIHKTKLRNKDLSWNYCPNCGAKTDLEGVEDGR